ncbi:MAG: hypothetical protein AAGI38_24165 [Bacteroidota bacterium]
MKHVTSLLLLLGTLSFAQGQVSLSYFPFQSVISVSTSPDARVWGDLRLGSNTFFGNVTVEPHVMVNLAQKSWGVLYGGLGANFTPGNAGADISVDNGVSLDVGVRVGPFKQVENVQLIFELSPYVNTDFDSGLLRSFLGIAYVFRKKERG